MLNVFESSFSEIKDSLISSSQVFLQKFVVIVIVFVIAYFIIKGIDFVVGRIFKKTKFDEALEMFIQTAVRFVLWLIAVVIALAIIGVNVSALVASLGILGFVLGFALKDTLGNLASGAMIMFYRPFLYMDYVEIGGVAGRVKKIGISACKIDTPDNKRVIIPNSSILSQPIINYTRHTNRRLEIIVGIGYGDDINKAIKVINEILKKEKRVLEDPAPMIAVKELADSSVNLLIRPWTKNSDFWDVHFYLMKTIKEEFDRNNIQIPFPQRVVTMKEPVKAAKPVAKPLGIIKKKKK